jgi:hypothetical protein
VSDTKQDAVLLRETVQRVITRMRHRADGIVDGAAVSTWADLLEEALTTQPDTVAVCVRCGGKGYIQSTPRTFDTDSAAECMDALMMARRDCPDCKPQATAPDEVQREQQPRRTEEEEEEEVNAYIRSETDDNGQLLYPNYGLKAAPDEVQRLRDALKAMAKEYRDLDLPYGSAAYVKAMVALNDTGFEFGMAAYGLRETEAGRG